MQCEGEGTMETIAHGVPSTYGRFEFDKFIQNISNGGMIDEV